MCTYIVISYKLQRELYLSKRNVLFFYTISAIGYFNIICDRCGRKRRIRMGTYAHRPHPHAQTLLTLLHHHRHHTHRRLSLKKNHDISDGICVFLCSHASLSKSFLSTASLKLLTRLHHRHHTHTRFSLRKQNHGIGDGVCVFLCSHASLSKSYSSTASLKLLTRPHHRHHTHTHALQRKKKQIMASATVSASSCARTQA